MMDGSTKDISTAGNGERRTEMKDLPRKEKELSKDEQKRVKGGYSIWPADREGATGAKPVAK